MQWKKLMNKWKIFFPAIENQTVFFEIAQNIRKSLC